MVRAQGDSYGQGMDVMPPPAAPDADLAEPESPTPPGRIVAGVAYTVALRLGVDALWVRLAFVILALLNGIGLFVYAALWLVLIGGARREWAVLRWIGGAALVVGLPLLISGISRTEFVSGPVAVIALLVGLALALWAPRSPTFVAPHVLAADRVSQPRAEERARRLPRPPSILARATLGVAVVVAAAGALIDQANGGRMHPEQWLGVGAAVCGLGLLVGAVRGHGNWLIVPALLFAGAGFVGGTIARVGGPWNGLSGERWVWLGQHDSLVDVRQAVVFGKVVVDARTVANAPRRVEVVSAFGSIEIRLPQGDVAVEVRVRAPRVIVDGRDDVSRTYRFGRVGDPLLRIDARVGRGTVRIWTPEAFDQRYGGAALPPPDVHTATSMVPLPAYQGQLTQVHENVQIAADGTVVLANGEAVIDPLDQVLTGQAYPMSNSTVIVTDSGDFRLLPRSLLMAPEGEILDLQTLRTSVPAPPNPSTMPSAPVSTTSTVPTTSTTLGG